MIENVKEKIHKLLDTIQDEQTLAQVMEDVVFYSSKQEVTDSLNDNQLKELSEAMKEADNHQVIGWADFKNELNEWKKKS